MRARLAGLALVAAVAISACGGSAPEVETSDGGTPDPVLEQGRDLYQSNCAVCHGNSGGGGRGPRLDDGRVADKYPDVDEQVDIVANGRRGMPGFGEKLTPDEIDAVVRYTREVL